MAPAFIRSPPPTAPGIPSIHSSPPRPALFPAYAISFNLAPTPAVISFAVNVDLIEIAAAWMNHHASNPAIANEQVRSAANDEKRKIFAPAEANQFRQRILVARLNPKFRRATDAQVWCVSKAVRKGERRPLRLRSTSIFPRSRDLPRGSTIAREYFPRPDSERDRRVQHAAYIAMHPIQTRLITDPAMTVRRDFIGDRLAANSGNRRFAGGINIGHHHAVGVVESLAKFLAPALWCANIDAVETSSARACVCGPGRLQRGADLGGMMRVVVHQQETIALIFDFEPAARVLELAK